VKEPHWDNLVFDSFSPLFVGEMFEKCNIFVFDNKSPTIHGTNLRMGLEKGL
jgi:hypothetical protein